jgi:hypothetical protein
LNSSKLPQNIWRPFAPYSSRSVSCIKTTSSLIELSSTASQTFWELSHAACLSRVCQRSWRSSLSKEQLALATGPPLPRHLRSSRPSPSPTTHNLKSKGVLTYPCSYASPENHGFHHQAVHSEASPSNVAARVPLVSRCLNCLLCGWLLRKTSRVHDFATPKT